MPKATSNLENYLKKYGYSHTKVRQYVFDVLNNKEPQSINALVSALSNVNRSSVYRTLNVFESIGVVHRVQMGWKHKFELSDIFNDHHHHMTCTNCSKVIDITDTSKIEKALEKTARDLGFAAKTHQIEIQGLCRKCQIK